MKKLFYLLMVVMAQPLLSCGADDSVTKPVTSQPPTGTTPPTEGQPTEPTQPVTTGRTSHYLALGDSYTIGQSVCETCRFPAQLKIQLEATPGVGAVETDIIATTGWTTTNLLSAIASQNPPATYDMVTLLIGVNNQYQQKPFSLYQAEFPQLLQKAIALAKGDASRVIVVSIPDYGYTPFGVGYNSDGHISAEIDQYNMFAKTYAASQSVAFVDITDITRQGLNNTSLVASDGLHPSESAYTLFVERLLPLAKVIINK